MKGTSPEKHGSEQHREDEERRKSTGSEADSENREEESRMSGDGKAFSGG